MSYFRHVTIVNFQRFVINTLTVCDTRVLFALPRSWSCFVLTVHVSSADTLCLNEFQDNTCNSSRHRHEQVSNEYFGHFNFECDCLPFNKTSTLSRRRRLFNRLFNGARLRIEIIVLNANILFYAFEQNKWLISMEIERMNDETSDDEN